MCFHRNSCLQVGIGFVNAEIHGKQTKTCYFSHVYVVVWVTICHTVSSKRDAVCHGFNNIMQVSITLLPDLQQVGFLGCSDSNPVLKISVYYSERRRGRVVRAARLWCRKSPYRVSSRLSWAMRGLENSVNPAENGYLFRIREG